MSRAVDHTLEIDAVGRAAGRLTGTEPEGGTLVEALSAYQVTAFWTGQRDARLCEPLPHVAFLARTGLPPHLEGLVNGERP